jgi:hypothetical protein
MPKYGNMLPQLARTAGPDPMPPDGNSLCPGYPETSLTRLLRDIFVSVLAMACFIALIELAMRVVGVHFADSLYRPDRDLGNVLRPDAAGWSVEEREQFIRINSQGLRDREHSIARPQGVIRIAVLGDSYAEAAQMADKSAFWSVMERDLNEPLRKLGKQVEVINFGVAGYGLPQEYQLLRERVWQYEPQIVVLTGNLHSLILRSSRKFNLQGVSDGPVPFFVRRDGKLVLDNVTVQQQRDFVDQSPRQAAIANLTNASRILALINGARRAWANELKDLLHRLQGIKEPSLLVMANLEDQILRGPALGPDFDDAWEMTQDLLRACQEDVADHRAEFWLFLMDMPPQVDPNAERRLRVQRALGIDDLFATDKLIDGFAGTEGIRHEWLSPQMLTFAEANHVALHGFSNSQNNIGHWNERGHALVGDLMAQQLLACSDVIRDARELAHSELPTICNNARSPHDKGP